MGQLRQLRAAGQVVGVRLDVLDGQLHMPRRYQWRRAPEGVGEVVRPGFQHRIDQHFAKARRHQ
ncbi:hypothetical protein D3C72_513740 [compost metagenome]